MIKFKTEIEYKTLDKDRYIAKIKENFHKHVKIAALKFAEAALKMIPSPPPGNRESEFATGFAISAFNNLLDAVGDLNKLPRINTNLPATFKKAERTKRQTGLTKRIKLIEKGGRTVSVGVKINPYYYPPGGGRVLKTPAAARQFATPVNKVFEEQGDDYIFNYEIDISYFNLQELANIGRSRYAPWQSFKAGREAFLKYMDSLKQTDILPKLDEFIVKGGG